MRRKLKNTLLLSSDEYAVVEGETGTHVATKDFCSCIGYATRKKCKHIELVKNMKLIDVDEKREKMSRKFSSSLNAVRKLFDDEPYTNNAIFAIYGEAKVGKTLFCIQEATWLNAKGHNVLYIDTEGGTDAMIEKWRGVLIERFGQGKGKLIYGSEKSVMGLLNEFGIEGEIKAKGEKMEFHVNKLNIEKSKIVKAINDLKIDFLILDSLSAPFRQITTTQQNFPVRADMMAILLTTILDIMNKHGVGVIVTNHASLNPAKPYQSIDATMMRGGSVVQYYCKRVIYISRRMKKEFKDIRKFWLVRAEDVQDWSRVSGAKITDVGYVDISDDELRMALTDGEVERIETNNQ